MNRKMNRFAIASTLLQLSALCLLTACGGGGSGSAKGGQNPPPPANSPVGVLSDSDNSGDSVLETALAGTAVGITLHATDPDAADTISYDLVDDAGGRFAVGPSSGAVGVAGDLDFESATSHTIRGRARSSDGSSSEADFSISVLDDSNEPPVLTLQFPVSNDVMTVWYAGTDIDITGQVADPQGHPTTVRVDSAGMIVDAIVDVAGNWRAFNVPIDSNGKASTALTVFATNSAGAESSTQVTISTEQRLIAPIDISLDQIGNRAFLTDRSLRAILAVDLATGSRDVVASSEIGSGEVFATPINVVYDTASSRLIAYVGNHLQSIDLASGVRTYFSGPTRGSGPELPSTGTVTGSMAIDTAANRLIVAGFDVIIGVDLVTGNRTSIADNTTGTGPELGGTSKIAIQDATTAYLTTGDAILAVDLGSGDRSIVSGPGMGSGPDLRLPIAMGLDIDNNRLFVGTDSWGSVISVDLSTGDRVLVSETRGPGSGPALVFPTDIVWDSTASRIIVADRDAGQLLQIAPDSGNRAILSGNGLGAGEILGGGRDIRLDLANDRAFVGTSYLDRLISIDLTTGDRVTVSGNGVGAGTDFNGPNLIANDLANSTVFVKQVRGIVAVNMVNGNRTTVVDESAGSGPSMKSPADMAFDRTGNRMLFTMWIDGSVVSADMSTGIRSILSDALTGAGPLLDSPRGIAIDPAMNRALVSDVNPSGNALLGVDLTTGDRQILSGQGVGVGTIISNIVKIRIDDTSGRVFGIGQATDNLIEFSLLTGDRTEVSGPARGGGIAIDSPDGLDIDMPNNRAFVLSGTSLMIVELTSGDRVVLSR